MAAFGESPPTGYVYIEVPFSRVEQQGAVFGYFAPVEPYSSIEAFAKANNMMNAERQDFLDRSRVYRFPNTYLKHFHRCGEYYLQVGCERFDVLTSDPGFGKAVARAYTPLG